MHRCQLGLLRERVFKEMEQNDTVASITWRQKFSIKKHGTRALCHTKILLV